MSTNDSYYRHHVFICTNRRPPGHPRGCCADKDPEQIWEAMRQRVGELGLSRVRINKSGCLDRCEQAVAVVVYPDAVWYSVTNVDEAREIVDTHLRDGTAVERLMMPG